MVYLAGYLLDMAIYIGIYAILSLSLNLEYGHTGLANFGKVAFFMVGAYTSSLLALAGLPFPVGITAAMGMAALCGVLVSLPAIRLRADYLAIITLVFGEIIRIVLRNEEWLAGGVLGLRGIPEALPLQGAPYDLILLGHVALVYTVLGVFYLIIHLLTNSPYGRVLRAIREDEEAVQALGKNTTLFKVQAFALGSAMAGAAGSLYTQYLSYVGPDLFSPALTFTVWIMVLLGGPANNVGAVLGALIMQAFDRGTRILKDFLVLPVDPMNLRFIIIGILIILFLMYRPEGLLKEKDIRTVVG